MHPKLKSIAFFSLSILSLLISCQHGQNSQEKDSGQRIIDHLLPVVKKAELKGNNFDFTGEWAVEIGERIKTSTAFSVLEEELQSPAFNQIKLTATASSKIHLLIKEGSVAIGSSIDTGVSTLAQQAYRLNLAPGNISISANSEQGLYYGVLSFLQLLQSDSGKLQLPESEITDWPDLATRMIYWDDAHHLEKFEALKRIIRQASQYKVNAFALKLEGHFQFTHAPAMVEPYAFTAEQYQELTDYAKKYFVELVPYLDAPAHVSFILKHPEYAKYRKFPNNNYELSVIDTGAIRFIKSMFNDLLQANKGEKFVMLSTDEAYYTGKSMEEQKAAAIAGSNGKLLAQYIKAIADDFAKQGRTVLFWGEYPLKPADIPTLPSYLVNGEYNEMSADFRKQGIRQFVYTSTQGVEPIFPNYYTLQKDSVARDSDHSANRVAGMLKDIRTAVNEKKADLTGVVIAGWADAGLHPETFWLGYLTGTAMGWNLADSKADDLTARFFKLFYGPSKPAMKRIYELLSTQAEYYDLSWKWVPSDLRKPILGNSENIFAVPEKVSDQVIPMLPVPSAENLSLNINWDSLNKGRLDSVEKFFAQSNELKELINTESSAEKQPYNREVLKSVYLLCRQNLEMLKSLQMVNKDLQQAALLAGSKNNAGAVASLDSAVDHIYVIKKNRDSVFAVIKNTWYEEWMPLVKEANGRKFLHEVDDIKDHQPGRTIDLSYLIYRELNYPLGKWMDKVIAVRNKYAAKYHLPVSHQQLNWNQYE